MVYRWADAWQEETTARLYFGTFYQEADRTRRSEHSLSESGKEDKYQTTAGGKS